MSDPRTDKGEFEMLAGASDLKNSSDFRMLALGPSISWFLRHSDNGASVHCPATKRNPPTQYIDSTRTV